MTNIKHLLTVRKLVNDQRMVLLKREFNVVFNIGYVALQPKNCHINCLHVHQHEKCFTEPTWVKYKTMPEKLRLQLR